MKLEYKFLEPSYVDDAALILKTMNDAWDAVGTDAQQGMRLSFVPTHNLHYLAAYMEGKYAGLWVLNEIGGDVLEVHTLILPGFTGHAVALGAGALDWAFSEGVADKLSTKVPGFNQGATALAEAVGFVPVHVDVENYVKYGIPWNVTTYTLNKEQFYAHRSNRRRGIRRSKHLIRPPTEQGAEASGGLSPPTS